MQVSSIIDDLEYLKQNNITDLNLVDNWPTQTSKSKNLYIL